MRRSPCLPRPDSWWRSPWAAAAGLAALVLALAAGGAGLRDALAYDRAQLAHGEGWRLLSGHLVHLGWAHALLNAIGVLLCCALAPGIFRGGRLAVRLIALCLGVSGLMWRLSPQVEHYVGLSGVLYGLFVLGLAPQALQPLRQVRSWRAWLSRGGAPTLAMAVIVGWAAWQEAIGPSTSEEAMIGGRIVAVVHVWGLLSGAALALLEGAWRWVDARTAVSGPALPFWVRWLLLAFAVLCVALGVVGIFVPGMPTTVFILMAAWASVRGSPRLHRWLSAHPRFGPMLRNWEEGGRIGRRAKWMATLTMSLSAVAVACLVRPAWLAGAVLVVMAWVLAWLWLRPEPAPCGDDEGRGA